MTTTTFPIANINRLRHRAGEASQLPEECPEGWSKSPIDPMKVVAIFGPLKLKPGFVLRAYQFRAGGNGNGVVWAMPIDADFPDPDRCPRQMGTLLEAPMPPGALKDYDLAHERWARTGVN